jgi:G3E family GTPase
MVDAKHFEQHVDELNEPAEQVAFADLVLLNKTDLVDAASLERIESRIRGINGTAKILRTKNADAPIDKVLNVGAFDLQRALAVDDSFLEPEYPFEWGGAYQKVVGSEPLPPGALSKPIVLRSNLGYTGIEPRAQMFKNSQFVDAHVQVFAKHGGNQWTKLGEWQIAREMLTQ